MCKLIFTMPMEPSYFGSSVTTPRGYKAGQRLKRKKERETDLENRMELLSLRGVVTPFLLMHARVGLDCIGGHARDPAKPCESGVYDSSRVGYLSCVRGSCVPCSNGGDTSWHVRHSTSKDSMCHHTDISTLFCNSTA
jgi:hypothetical protein